MDAIAVVINSIIVHSVEAPLPGTSMMVAHKLRKVYCIDDMKAHGIDAGVWVERNGRMVEAVNTRMDDNILTVGSRMNDEGYEPEAGWWDDILNNLKPPETGGE
jgi:hypothetical protein